MKITFLLTTGDTNAGTEHAIASQIRSLTAKGHEVTVHSVYRADGSLRNSLPATVDLSYWISAEGHDLSGAINEAKAQQLFVEDSFIITRGWDDQFNRLSDQLARPHLESIRADVVVSTTPALAMLASLYLPADTVLVAQEHRASMQRGAGISPLAAVIHDVDAVVSLNPENEAWILEQFPGEGFVSAVIPNSLDNIYRPVASGKIKTIVGAGRFAPGKQFDHLIRAFGIFHSEHPDWTLRLFGEGPLRGRLQALSGELNLNASVEIMPPVAEMTEQWMNASIHAMTSRAEGQPLVILEAAASGIPTVAYDCPIGPRNILTHGHDGLLVPLNNVELFAASLARLASDEQLRRTMGDHAVQTAENYTPERAEARWGELYARLLRRREAGETRAQTNRRLQRNTPPWTENLNSSDAAGPATHIEKGRVKFEVPIVEPGEVSVQEIVDRNWEIACEVLNQSGIKSFEVPAYGHYRRSLAIREADRDSVIAALGSLGRMDLCVRAMRGNARSSANDWHPGLESMKPQDAEFANVLRLFVPATDELRRFTWGSAFGVDFEFWSPIENGAGYMPPRHNRGIDRLMDSDFAQDVEEFTQTLWDDINFPIDVVYTWVDDTDVDWQQSKQSYTDPSDELHPLAAGEMRFRNRDELRYSLRSVRSYMPWVRNIYLVTADQIPSWLAKESDIRVVSHREIFPDPSSLPVFNSHAIEANIHRIEGLAEHFLYFNDDTLLLRMQEPSTYFQPNGVAKIFLSPVKIDIHEQDVEPHMWAAQNNRALLQERFGKTITRGLLHTPHPHRRSTLEKIEAEYPELFSNVRSSRFRSEIDISLLSSFAQYFGYLTGAYAEGGLRYTYCPMGLEGTRQQLKNLMSSDRFDVLTFGEVEDSTFSDEEIDHLFDQFFRGRFPYATTDEKPE